MLDRALVCPAMGDTLLRPDRSPAEVLVRGLSLRRVPVLGASVAPHAPSRHPGPGELPQLQRWFSTTPCTRQLRETYRSGRMEQYATNGQVLTNMHTVGSSSSRPWGLGNKLTVSDHLLTKSAQCERGVPNAPFGAGGNGERRPCADRKVLSPKLVALSPTTQSARRTLALHWHMTAWPASPSC